MSLRIVLANENRGRGGAERYTVEMARALSKAGHHTWLACRPGSWLSQQGLECVEIDFRGEFDPLNVLRARSRLQNIQPQVVHCQATRDLSLLALWRRMFARKVALIKSQHSFLDGPGSWWLRGCFRSCDRVVAVSASLQEQMVGMLGPLPLEVIPNAMHLPPLRQPVPERLLKGEWLGYVGALIPSKRVDWVLQASCEWLREGGDRHVLIAGEGPELERLRQLSHELGIGENCWFAGYVQDPLPYLAALRVLVHPNPQETFSLVCLESMALQVPVVSFRAGGIAEVVVHEETGLLAERLEPAALTPAIRRYAESPELREVHGRAGRRRVAEHFSWEAILPRWLALYQRFGQRPS